MAMVPVRVKVPVPEPVMVTPPPELAAKVPEPTVITAVAEPEESTSEKLIADRSKLLALSSVTVMSLGTPVAEGSSLTAVISMLTLADVPLTVPSLGVMVSVAASLPLALAALVY